MAESAHIKVFPVVQRIREEIDFCFSAFYGDIRKDKKICNVEFSKWLEDGFRGPGQLYVYIDMLSRHLTNPTQKSIFDNLANDAITLKRKVEVVKSDSFFQRHKVTILLNLALLLVLAIFIKNGTITLG